MIAGKVQQFISSKVLILVIEHFSQHSTI